MEFWLTYLPIVIYFLLIAVLIMIIILGFKVMGTLSRIDKIADNINEKFDAINPIFHMIDFATDKIAALSDSFVDYFTGFLGKLMKRKEKREDDECEEK